MVSSFRLCNILLAATAVSALAYPTVAQDLVAYEHRGEDAMFDANGRLRSEPAVRPEARIRPEGIPVAVTAQLIRMSNDGRALFGPSALTSAVNFVVLPDDGIYVATAAAGGVLNEPVQVLSPETDLGEGIVPAPQLIASLMAFSLGETVTPYPVSPIDLAAVRLNRTAITINGLRVRRDNLQYLPPEALRWVAANAEAYRPPDAAPLRQAASN